MRVISGSARGLKLESLDGLSTRPTLDRVKEAIFSMLFDKTAGAAVLDLFAGSGAMGIEALSRGADGCVFVDSSREAAAVVGRNLSKAGFELKSVVRICSFDNFLQTCDKKFDLVFLDPPYRSDYLKKSLSLLHERHLLAQGAVVVLEHDKNLPPEIPEGFELVRRRSYGRVSVNILEET